MKTTSTPAVEWPPGGASSSPSTASPRRAATDFGALLDQHQARTATAEGPKKKEAKPDREPIAPASAAPARPEAEPKKADAVDDAQPVADQQQPQAPQCEGDEQQQPTVETPVVVVDPLVELTQPVLAEPQAPVPAADAEQPVAETPVQQQPVAAEQLPVVGKAAAAAPVKTDASVTQAPEAAAPVAVSQPQQAEQPQQVEQPQQPVAPAATAEPEAEATAPEAAPQPPVARADKPAQAQPQQPQEPQHATGDSQPQKQGADQRPAEQPRGQGQAQPQVAAASKPEPKVAPAAAPVSAPVPQAPVTAPVAAAAPQAPAAPAAASIRTVPLSRAAEAVENVIRLGSARGVTHARMSLRPAELGGIEIRLQQTAGGLVASVVADGVKAAQALLQAGGDLRRQLEAQGIELQRLDISYSGDERSGARSAETRTGDGEQRSSSGDSSHATDGGDLTPTDETMATSTLELPGGVLVDVLA